MQIRTDNIVRLQIKPNQELETSDFKEILKVLKSQAVPLPAYFIMEALPGASVDADIRKYVAHNNANLFSKADAFVLSTYAQKLVANVYMKFNKPTRPTMFFDHYEAAMEWLLSQKSAN